LGRSLPRAACPRRGNAKGALRAGGIAEEYPFLLSFPGNEYFPFLLFLSPLLLQIRLLDDFLKFEL